MACPDDVDTHGDGIFWAKYDPLQVLRAGMLSLEKKSGRYVRVRVVPQK